MNKILSFDVSSVSTGWAYLLDGKLQGFGAIKPSGTLIVNKLIDFSDKVKIVLEQIKPSTVVIEETYMKNVKTLKVLMQFIGVLQLLCGEYAYPIFTYPASVRSMFKLKGKEEVFDYIKNKYQQELSKCIFEDTISTKTKVAKNYVKDNLIVANDISDAILQALYVYNKGDF